jgi:cell division protein FtsB
MAEKPASRPPSNRSTGQLSGVQVMFAITLAVGLLLAINFSSRIAAGKPLLDAYDKVNAEIQALRLEQATLSAELEYVKSEAYIERWARDNGKMVRPGERLIVPVPAGTVAPTASPVVNVEQQFESGIPTAEPWQVWWGLFFDSTPPPLPGSSS